MKKSIGQTIIALVANKTIEAKVIGIGYHKGRLVYDLDNQRFVYASQVIA